MLSSSSSSSVSAAFSLNTHKPRTMEEVWKDIHLASLHENPSSTDHNPNFILQDFFARPFNKDPPSTTRLVSSTNNNVLPPIPPPPPPPPVAPATVLSLNSSVPVGFDLLENSHLHHHLQVVSSFNNNNNNRNNGNNNNNNSNYNPFECLDSSSGFGEKRVQESDNHSGDRRHKRMIKNRESAARSRARRQAYTIELEAELKHLKEENARLKRQQEELYLAATSQHPKKHTLHRTSTAPF